MRQTQTYRVHAGHEARPAAYEPLNTWDVVEARSATEAADQYGQEHPKAPFICVAWQSGSGFESLFSVIHNQPVYTVETFENGYHNDEP